MTSPHSRSPRPPSCWPKPPAAFLRRRCTWLSWTRGWAPARRPILVRAAGQYFVAPDNGVLSLIYAREQHQVRAITAERFFRQPVSRTFHGRDIFAPVAAHLARGVPPPRFGKLISDYERGDFAAPTPNGPRRWTGRVLKVDRFGNLITNFAVDEFSARRERPVQRDSRPAAHYRLRPQLRRGTAWRAVSHRGKFRVLRSGRQPSLSGETDRV